MNIIALKIIAENEKLFILSGSYGRSKHVGARVLKLQPTQYCSLITLNQIRGYRNPTVLIVYREDILLCHGSTKLLNHIESRSDLKLFYHE